LDVGRIEGVGVRVQGSAGVTCVDHFKYVCEELFDRFKVNVHL